MRTGIVQSPKGRLAAAAPPAVRSRPGGKIGDGRQWLSWIGVDDLTDAYLHALVDPALSGPVNGVAPDPVRNADYTVTLGRVLRRPAMIPVPDRARGCCSARKAPMRWPRPASASGPTRC